MTEEEVVTANGKTTAAEKTQDVDEKIILKDVDEKITPKDVDEKITPKDVDEKITPKDVKEKITPKDVDEKITPKDVDEKITPKDVKEKIIPKDVDEKIIRQVEYYFGDYNLPRDKFLQEEIKKDEGWIALETMTKFKRLATLSTDYAVISAALRKSKNNILEVHENNEKIRRIPTRPLPLFNDDVKEETVKRTVYCKGFAKDGSVTLDDLLEYYKQYGPYETVLMRYFHDKETQKQGFKGSVYVVFPTPEKAKEFREMDEVRYKDILLIRKWQSEYLEEKRKEIEERRARKEARMNKARDQNKEGEAEEEVELPKGTFIHFSGIKADSDVSREDLKEALGDCAENCAFVDYSRGLTEGFFRFKEAEYNAKVIEKTEGKLKVKEMEVVLRVVEGEEEDEQLKKMKEAQRNCKNRGFGSRKRKMGGGRGGFQNKRRRL